VSCLICVNDKNGYGTVLGNRTTGCKQATHLVPSYNGVPFKTGRIGLLTSDAAGKQDETYRLNQKTL
jgi:hypothetical protein